MMHNKLRISLFVAFGALALTTIVLYASPVTSETMLDETTAAETGPANVNLDYGKNNQGSVQVYLIEVAIIVFPPAE
jgi:hypothetical protein